MNEKDFIPILDLHGTKSDEIENVLDKWLESFKNSDFEKASIVVGLGSKTLSKKVIDYINNKYYAKCVPDVKSKGVLIVSKTNIVLGSNSMGMTNILNYLKNVQTTYTLNYLNIKGLFGLFNYNINFVNENVYVIHAPNGCGKSNLLKLINTLFNKKNAINSFPFEKIEISFNDDKYEISWDESKKKINSYKCSKSVLLGDNWSLVKKDIIDDILFDVECTYMNDLTSYDLNTIKKVYLKRIIYDKENAIERKVTLFNKIMEEFFCFEKTVKISKKWRRASNIDYIFDIIYDAPNLNKVPNVYKKGEHIPFEKLSTGEQNIIKIIFRLIFGTKYNSLVILDEPEISLHMEWQMLLIDNIVKIAKDYDLKVLIATHSPYILDNPHIEIGNAVYEEEK